MEHTVVELGPTEFVGLQVECPFEDPSAVPPLWERFWQTPQAVPGSQGVYGVSWAHESEPRFTYLAAHRVDSGAAAPEGWARKGIPATRFAVFPFDGPPEQIGPTIWDIVDRRLPELGLSTFRGGLVLEHYPPGCWNEAEHTCKADLYVELA